MRPSFISCCFLWSLLVVQVQSSCYSSLRGVAMTGCTFKVYKVNSFYDCYSECKTSNYTCRSINYFIQTTLCHHNSLKISDKPENKIQHHDSVYVDNSEALGNATSSHRKWSTQAPEKWVLAARFSNVDIKSWVWYSGTWWYDLTSERGDKTSTVVNQDMISKAFWTTKGNEIKITRTDDPEHTPLLTTTSNCLGGKTFRQKITGYGNFRDGKVWSSDKCLGKCTVEYSGKYASTAGFSRTKCDSNVLTRNQIGFWCHYGKPYGAGAVISIGGAGSACDRADHGLGVTEENAGKFGKNIACDFGDNGQSTCIKQSYALNLWIQEY